MPRFTIEVDLNDGKRNAPPVVVEGDTLDDVLEEVLIHGRPDHTEFFGVGHTITVKRTA
jgi:hypothetical protein